jgi:hypothetical protein
MQYTNRPAEYAQAPARAVQHLTLFHLSFACDLMESKTPNGGPVAEREVSSPQAPAYAPAPQPAAYPPQSYAAPPPAQPAAPSQLQMMQARSPAPPRVMYECICTFVDMHCKRAHVLEQNRAAVLCELLRTLRVCARARVDSLSET